GLVLARVLDRGDEVQRGRDPASGVLDLLRPRNRPRGQDRRPQAAVGAHVLLRGEVVDIGLGDVDVEPTGPGSRVDDDKSVVVDAVGAGDRCGDTGRGLIVRPGEHIGGELAGGRRGGGGDETGGGQGRRTG